MGSLPPRRPHLKARTARDTCPPLLALVKVAKSSHWKGTPPPKNSCGQAWRAVGPGSGRHIRLCAGASAASMAGAGWGSQLAAGRLSPAALQPHPP